MMTKELLDRQVAQPLPVLIQAPARRRRKKGDFVQTLYHYVNTSPFAEWTENGVGFRVRYPLAAIGKYDETFRIFSSLAAFHKNLNMHGYTQPKRGERTWTHRGGLSLRDLGAQEEWYRFRRTPERRRVPQLRQLASPVPVGASDNDAAGLHDHEEDEEKKREPRAFLKDEEMREDGKTPFVPVVPTPPLMAVVNAAIHGGKSSAEEQKLDGGIDFFGTYDAPGSRHVTDEHVATSHGQPTTQATLCTQHTMSNMEQRDSFLTRAATHDRQEHMRDHDGLVDEHMTFDKNEMMLLGHLDTFLNEYKSDGDDSDEEDLGSKSDLYQSTARAHQPSANDVKAAETTSAPNIATAETHDKDKINDDDVFQDEEDATNPPKWEETGDEEEEEEGDTTDIMVAAGKRVDTTGFGSAVPMGSHSGRRPHSGEQDDDGARSGGGEANYGDNMEMPRADSVMADKRNRWKRVILAALILTVIVTILCAIVYLWLHFRGPRSPFAITTNDPTAIPSTSPTVTPLRSPHPTPSPTSHEPSLDPSKSPSTRPTTSPTSDTRILVVVKVLADVSGTAVQNVSAPQHQAAVWIEQNSTSDELDGFVHDKSALIQRYALAVFYFALGGSTTWGPSAASTWLMPGLSECEWIGITCNEESRVTAFKDLGLDDMFLQGSLPNELFELTSMEEFVLRKQPGLVGTLSASISKWINLNWIDLSENNLEGSLPPEFPSSLTQLRIYRNRFTGPLLTSLLPSNLRVLMAHENMFSGTLPTGLGGVGNLTSLILWGNLFTGSIPEDLYDLKQLKDLILSLCMFTGTIPAAIGKLVNLRALHFHGNNFSGAIPMEIGRLGELRNLKAHSNQLTGPIPTQLGRLRQVAFASFHTNQLTGSLPTQLGKMESLLQLVFFNNQLNGTISDELTLFPNMKIFDLDRNRLSGTIPKGLANMQLEELWLFENRLTGTLPTELSTLENVKEFWLSNNSLVGTIPSEYGNMVNTRTLSISGNDLTGTIPPELGSLRALERLWVGDNNLNGTIPTELGMLENLQLMYLSDAGLSGTIPTQIGQLAHLESLRVANNSLTGTVPTVLCIGIGFTTNMTHLEADCKDLDGSPEVVCDCCTHCF